jgi:hypothetical protein
VGVDALGLIVLGEVEGAELGLVVEHVEVIVLDVVVDERGEYFLLVVGVGAVVPVEAVSSTVRVVRAELLLVLLVVVVLLHEGVGEEAGIAVGALLVLLDEAAHLGVVEVAVSLSILGVVVVHAVLVVVGLGDVAGGDLERLEVEMLREEGRTLTMGTTWNW